MHKASSKIDEVAVAIDPLNGDVIALLDVDDPEGRGYTSPKSPNDLRFARSHEELAGRRDPPLSDGLSLREALETEDYWNWD